MSLRIWKMSAEASTLIVGCAAWIADEAARTSAAYRAGSGFGFQKFVSHGSFQISTAVSGRGSSCGLAAQNVPPGP